MTNALVLPERFKNIEQVDNLVVGWENVKLAIRPECRNDVCLEKAKVALQVNLNDSAINYIWNLTIYDLYQKIVKYGIDYFASAINWDGKPLRKIEDLQEVKDYQVIDGAYALGIIPDEALFFLQQCREIRNHFSAAHYPIGELDRFEISAEKLNKGEEISLILENQSKKIQGPILHSLFSNFIKQDCNACLKYNIKLLAPKLWSCVDEEVKSSIASKFTSLKDITGQDEANEALAFLKLVDGVSYIPQGYLDVIFNKHAQLLIDAHFASNNFYTEPGYAKDLASLGYDVPLSAVNTYVKAIVLSYVGNCYGISNNAQTYNKEMLLNLSQTGIRVLFRVISSDRQVVRELSSQFPAGRLRLLMDIIKEKTMLPEQKQQFDFIVQNTPDRIAREYSKRYNELIG